ncbi:hypothetical protein BDY17DRAFT_323158 [Neohortaea acidophila]|uniref:Uncharacterized protein n=1 Tax=Neohortaea acidophila TaxID=245834 RepID=A0A6A6PVX4_9PEZI|nr:uncharacterized protein BDY17DRAFT_323158 [Neohortaea acidophila]KAF2484290.1 hypothetical protein BDY17DRAFT_323158 [Neohortaea acidophila]
MAEANNPISPTRFASALESLPLDALHAKAAEIQNSIAHLKHSNDQMLPFAEEGDQECKEAMFENLTVIGRMNERVRLLKEEVERRGYLWGEEVGGDEKVVNGLATAGAAVNGAPPPTVNGGSVRQSGRLTDEELRRRMEERMADVDDGEDDDGVHL